MNISFDQGYAFGMGVFETIAVHHGIPLFLPEHLHRMEKGKKHFGITTSITPDEVLNFIAQEKLVTGGVKLMLSQENKILLRRDIPYTKADYEKGFLGKVTSVYRNETSPLTYIKSFHYGDNLLEKAKAKQEGFDEALFLNSKGFLCESATANIFFVKKGRLYTPKLECGLLSGIIRDYLLSQYDVEETFISISDLSNFEEAFLTNSLLGILPLRGIDDHRYETFSTSQKLFRTYCDTFQILI